MRCMQKKSQQTKAWVKAEMSLFHWCDCPSILSIVGYLRWQILYLSCGVVHLRCYEKSWQSATNGLELFRFLVQHPQPNKGAATLQALDRHLGHHVSADLSDLDLVDLGQQLSMQVVTVSAVIDMHRVDIVWRDCRLCTLLGSEAWIRPGVLCELLGNGQVDQAGLVVPGFAGWVGALNEWLIGLVVLVAAAVAFELLV